MILIADSGSTKTDWRIISKNQDHPSMRTLGMNPYYQSADDITKSLEEELLPYVNPEEIQEIFFYGSGCADSANCLIISSILEGLFPFARTFVSHDMVAAARATCGHRPGIACILGTGSNAGYYDGKGIKQQPVNLGYVLGDEGGGVHLGKLLITDFLHQELPSSLQKKFSLTYPSTQRNEVMKNIYQKPQANRYLASFAHFLYQNLEEPYAYQLIYQSFTAFIEKYVAKTDKYPHVPIHFVGSIAFYFKEVLKVVIQDNNLILGKILENPMEGLIQYHQALNIN